mmetsp:Transcript_41537/g.97201  ORF Transcript_41537/g.97201 Transcript_41537/m.97201 type:complete len:205 (+) Transcript_41537:152-766(+)
MQAEQAKRLRRLCQSGRRGRVERAVPTKWLVQRRRACGVLPPHARHFQRRRGDGENRVDAERRGVAFDPCLPVQTDRKCSQSLLRRADCKGGRGDRRGARRDPRVRALRPRAGGVDFCMSQPCRLDGPRRRGVRAHLKQRDDRLPAEGGRTAPVDAVPAVSRRGARLGGMLLLCEAEGAPRAVASRDWEREGSGQRGAAGGQQH